MSKKKPVVGLIVMILCAAPAATAHDLHSPMFSFNGFGTVGVVHSSEDKADYTSSVFSPDGAGFTRRWSPEVDSRIGAQVSAALTTRLSAVVQVVAEQRYDDTYRPAVEWANVKFAFTPDFSVRVGRIALPGFLASDYRKVGYALPWVRPPGDVYGLMPVSTNDGIDAIYRTRIGELGVSVQAHYGSEEATTPEPRRIVARAKNGSGIVNTFEYRALSGYVNYQQARVSLTGFELLFDGLRQFGPEGMAIADKYGTKNKSYQLVSLGANYDPGEWFVTGEWARTATHSLVGDKTAWYVGGGYRFGRLTPYAIYSTVSVDSNTSDAGVSNPAAAGLNAELNAILGATPAQTTLSIGARWDVVKNTAIKFQYDHIDLDEGSPGPLSNLQSDFQPGGTVDVVSIALDFVF